MYSTVIGTTCTSHHNATTLSGGLDMATSQAAAFTNLTTGTSAEADAGCSEKYVVSGNAAQSLLYQKVSGTGIPGACGTYMPKGGTMISTTNQTLIENWINQGAHQ